ncbi:hypothetical protein Tco_0548944 [Tanacetum coccineum]
MYPIRFRFHLGRKDHFLEDKQIPSVGVFDEVFSTWMVFGGNTRNLGSFGEETDKTTTLHHLSRRIVHTKRGDGVTSIKRHRHDLSSDGVVDFVTASGHSRLKVDLEPSTWRRRHGIKATPYIPELKRNLISLETLEKEGYTVKLQSKKVKSLATRLYLKKKLYTFNMHPGKSRSEHIDEFHKLVGDLAAKDTAILDEDHALLLLTALPSSYNNFMETLPYGRDTLKLEDVLVTLNS